MELNSPSAHLSFSGRPERSLGGCVLASTYFGPLQWYQKLYRYSTCFIDGCEQFVKQTYRNRCVIASTNGPLSLSIPVERTTGSSATHSAMKDIRISNHGNWRHIHWQAIVSAYSESPFFEYYADDIRPFFTRRWEWLFDFNLETTRTLCTLLDIQPTLLLTQEYLPAADGYSTFTTSPSAFSACKEQGSFLENPSAASSHLRSESSLIDFRNTISPKNALPDADFSPRDYYQVFAQKHGFLPNLSILDLLFNMGNEAIFYL